MRAQERFCTVSAFLSYLAAAVSLPARQLFVITRFPAAANYIELTTSLCYSLIDPLFVSLLLFLYYIIFFFLALFTPFCATAETLVYEKMIVVE